MTKEEYFLHAPNRVAGLCGSFSLCQGAYVLSDLVPALNAKIDGCYDSDDLHNGKVRDCLMSGKRMLVYTSDRVSAFDVVLGTVPLKGEILNALSWWWFSVTSDIIKNHALEHVGGRGMLCTKAEVLPVEVVVRGYLTGGAWRDYQSEGMVSGIALPFDMRKNQKFAVPIITPSTKAGYGEHDRPISVAEIIEEGIVKPGIWAQIEKAALALFQRGQSLCNERGLLLADTKYEFGLLNDELILIDELHTPDSSRFWYRDSYQARFSEGLEPEQLDKEYLRSWLMERGWRGTGEVPKIPDEVFLELGWKYVQAYQEITGEDFSIFSPNPQAEAVNVLSVL